MNETRNVRADAVASVLNEFSSSGKALPRNRRKFDLRFDQIPRFFRSHSTPGH